MSDDDENFEPSDGFVRAWNAMAHPVENPTPTPDRAAVEALLMKFATSGLRWCDENADLILMCRLAECLLAAGGQEATAEKTPSTRADAVLRAAGLSGKFDRNHARRDAVMRFVGFQDGDGGKAYTVTEGIREARSAGLIPDTVDDATVRKDINRKRR